MKQNYQFARVITELGKMKEKEGNLNNNELLLILESDFSDMYS